MTKREKADIWMPLYIGDYLADTTRLTTEQHGAYLLLIMDYWRSGKLPDNDAVLMQITRLQPNAWSNARAMLEQFFSIENGFWIHSRIDKELELAQKNNLDKKVGIYFRLSNDPTGKEFNELIAEREFNQELNSSTEVVGIQGGKIPKFLLTTKWKPMSVVCIGNSLKQSKTAVYSYNCDLIIQYSDSKPLFETKILWE